MRKLKYIIIFLLILVPNIYTADQEKINIEDIEPNLQITESNYPLLSKLFDPNSITKFNSWDINKKILSLICMLPSMEKLLRKVNHESKIYLKAEMTSLINSLQNATKGGNQNKINKLIDDFNFMWF
ncbi:MAG: hypothetical protein P4L22_02180 [Candidatus Babeliales bacterium]|nr:hypothetical protein [Candidatus Babeliales bacterium]